MNNDEEYCDLVTKGSIASGIAYTNAVLALAKRYLFKNIGGTLPGAIAAAAAAAAALGQRRKDLEQSFDGAGVESAGFAGLQSVAGQLTGKGFIYSLFQPAVGGRAAFQLLVSLTSRAGPAAVSAATLRAFVTVAPLEFILTLSALLSIGWAFSAMHGVWAALLPALVCALGVALVAGLLRVARAVRRNRLGLCSGMRDGDRQTGQPALTEWLHDVLQRLAGGSDKLLVVADLWTAPQYAQEPVTEKILSLAVITTSVPTMNRAVSETGRPSIDPALMIRMLLIGYCLGIRPERRLCEEVHLNLAYRWFCRLGLEGAVPDHSTFSKNRHGRFRDSDLLRDLFEMTVTRCIAEGLVGGEGFAVDASLIKADANRQRGVPGEEGLPPDIVNHAAREYPEVLDAAAFGAV